MLELVLVRGVLGRQQVLILIPLTNLTSTTKRVKSNMKRKKVRVKRVKQSQQKRKERKNKRKYHSQGGGAREGQNADCAWRVCSRYRIPGSREVA